MSELTSRVETILAAIIAGVESGITPKSRVEALLELLNDKIDALVNAKDWIGVTTTPLYDGATTNPITINGASVTAVNGDMTSYNSVEFIFNGTTWQEFGRKIKIGNITLGTTWAGNDPYTQVVSVTGAVVTANSMIDLQPTAAQLSQMITDGIQGLTVSNNNGTITITSIGAPTTTEMTVQCTVTEVEQ